MRQKFVALLLCGALLAGLPLSAAAFADVTDPALAEAVGTLRELKIVNGKPDGSFDPQGTFTRAEFCKMALVALGREQEAELYQNRVIFTDVTAAHWALGYINAAAAVSEGAIPLVQGKGNGAFAPDDAITCGEAVTILVRCLGYSDADVGGVGGAWYAGHMLRARSIGLLDGLEGVSGGDTLTRAQAAHLFENLLYTEGKDSDRVFLETALGGTVGESQLVLEVKGKALSAGGWAARTDKASYVTFRADLDPALRGSRCKPVLDKEGNLVALLPDEDYTTRAVRILSAEARYIIADGDEQILIPTATPLWRSGGEQESYGAVYKEIAYGANAVLCYDKADALASVYLLDRDESVKTAVAKEGSGPFDQLLDGASVQVYRNGLPATLSAVRPYDVGEYDSRAGVLKVTDNKLTGVYENADPSPVSPNTVTLMGHAFPVLDCALADLAGYRLGDPMTLLLTEDYQVAGVVSPAVSSGMAIGTAVVTQGENDARGRETYDGKLTLPCGIVLSGKVRTNNTLAAQVPGRLYTATASQIGELDLLQARATPAPGDWDVAGGTMGGARVSPQAVVYDKTESGALKRVELEAVTVDTVPAKRISLAHRDSAGTVDYIVLDNVTGDCYTYGLVTFTAGDGYTDSSLSVANAKGSVKLTTGGGFTKLDGQFMGLAAPLSSDSHQPLVTVSLQAHAQVPRTDFSEKTVTVDGVVYPLSDEIDQCCYNAVSETWFPSLDAALSYAGRLTVYVDRAPEQGGKVRLVVAAADQ